MQSQLTRKSAQSAGLLHSLFIKPSKTEPRIITYIFITWDFKTPRVIGGFKEYILITTHLNFFDYLNTYSAPYLEPYTWG